MIWTIPILAIATSAAAPLGAGDHTRSVQVGNANRTYLVHIPKSYDKTRPTPVVLAFHGGGSNARQMVRFSGLNDKADRAGFIVVYPSGSGRFKLLTWNAGNCCGYAMRNNVDDVAFTRALLDELGRVVRIDSRRVYATGMSNGAMISYRLASELSDRIAAIAPVAAPMGTKTCRPKRPVPVIHFHGTDDEFAPFKGGKGARSLTATNFYSAEYSVNAWVKANGCKPTPITKRLPAKVNDGTTITQKTYAGGKNGSEVVLVVIHGGGHTWPGKPTPLKRLGKTTRNISANDMMWEFFKRHPMR